MIKAPSEVIETSLPSTIVELELLLVLGMLLESEDELDDEELSDLLDDLELTLLLEDDFLEVLALSLDWAGFFDWDWAQEAKLNRLAASKNARKVFFMENLLFDMIGLFYMNLKILAIVLLEGDGT